MKAIKLEKGPVKKSFSTYQCEEVASLLLDDKNEFHFDINKKYLLLKFSHSATIFNITLLFKYTNFFYLNIKKDDLELYEDFILKENLLSTFINDKTKTNIFNPKVFPELSLAEKIGINVYTEDFRLLNAILRGDMKELTEEIEIPDSSSQPLILKKAVLSILIGAQGLSKLKLATEAIPFFYRVETKTQQTQKLLEQRIRAAESLHLKEKALICQGFFSTSEVLLLTSEDKEFNVFFSNFNTINPNYPSIAPLSEHKEKEHLFMPNSQIIFLGHDKTQDLDLFYTQIAPSLEPMEDSYIPDHALVELTPIFTQSFKDTHLPGGDSDEQINGVLVPRVWHNLVYVLAVRHLVEPAACYLANHAKDKNLQEYFSTLSHDKLKIIQTISQFLKAGRQSEITHREFPKIYKDYQENSGKIFIQYAKNHISHFADWKEEKNLIQHLGEVVKSYADPEFQEKNQDNEWGFIAKLLDICHNLRLQRCFSISEFKKLIKSIEKESDINSAQSKDLLNLLLLNQDFSNALGDRISFCITPSGAYLEAERDWATPFELCSFDPDLANELLTKAKRKFYNSLDKNSKNINPFKIPYQKLEQARITLSQLILKKRYNVSIHKIDEKTGETVLHQILKVNPVADLNLFELLLMANANVSALDQQGKTPLQLSLKSGNQSLINILFKYTIMPIQLNNLFLTSRLQRLTLTYHKNPVFKSFLHQYKDSEGYPLLHKLVMYGKLDTMLHLIENRFSLEPKNNNGQNIFIFFITQIDLFIQYDNLPKICYDIFLECINKNINILETDRFGNNAYFYLNEKVRENPTSKVYQQLILLPYQRLCFKTQILQSKLFTINQIVSKKRKEFKIAEPQLTASTSMVFILNTNPPAKSVKKIKTASTLNPSFSSGRVSVAGLTLTPSF